MDYGAVPPEINSERMYAGPGSGPMLAAAAAWDGLGGALSSAAAEHSSVISELTEEAWLGTSSASMAIASASHVQWLTTMSIQAGQAGIQAKAAAAAYEAAFAAMVPPPVIAANRALLSALIETNVFGQNTPAIATTEAQYGEMWAQDSAAMYGYAGDSAAATTMTPFSPTEQTANSAGAARQAVAVTHAVGTSATGQTQTIVSTTQQSMFLVPKVLQALGSPSGSAGILGDILNFQPPPIVQSIEGLSTGVIFPVVTSSVWASAAIGWALTPVLAPAPVAAAPSVPFASYPTVNALGPGLGPTPLTANLGDAALLGDRLSVPQGWATAAPASLVATAVPSAAPPAVAPGGYPGPLAQMPLFGGAPLATLSGRDKGGADSRKGDRPDDEKGTPPAAIVGS